MIAKYREKLEVSKWKPEPPKIKHLDVNERLSSGIIETSMKTMTPAQS